MAVAQATYHAEMATRQGDPATITEQHVSNYADKGDDSQTMKALTWQGKNKVEVGTSTVYRLLSSLWFSH